VRLRHCVGGGAPVNFGRRRQRSAALPAQFFFKDSRKNFVPSSKFSHDPF